jgi:hypothetical protein
MLAVGFEREAVETGLARSPARFADRPAVIAGAGLALVLHRL